MPHLAGPGLDSTPGIEQGLLCGSSAGSGRGRGRLPVAEEGGSSGLAQQRCLDAHLHVLCHFHCPQVGATLSMWGCHRPRATHFSLLSILEAHANPCRQHPGEGVKICDFPRASSLSVGQPPADCDSHRPTSEATSDLRPSPAHLASPCGSWKSSFTNSSLPLSSSSTPSCPCPPENSLETTMEVCHGGVAPSV